MCGERGAACPERLTNADTTRSFYLARSPAEERDRLESVRPGKCPEGPLGHHEQDLASRLGYGAIGASSLGHAQVGAQTYVSLHVPGGGSQIILGKSFRIQYYRLDISSGVGTAVLGLVVLEHPGHRSRV